jgi:aldehyde dehydrogenase (NAD+)
MWPVYNEIDLAVKRLPKWMKDEDRSGDAIWSFKTVSK